MSSFVPIKRSLLIAMGAVLASSLAQAQPAAPPQPADPEAAAAHSHAPHGKRLPELTLQAQAVAQVMQDTVTMTLAVEHAAADQAEVGRKLAETLDATMPVAKSVEEVKARNGAYRVWAVTNRDGKVTGWRGRAEIILESKEFAQAAELASKMSDTMPVSNVVFSLSDEARVEQERKLLAEAAQAFRDRALAAASAFGFAGYQIRKLDLGGGGEVYMRNQAARGYAGVAAASLSKAADMPLEADTVDVGVQVSGTVYLQ